MKEHLVVIGNGMAPGRTLERLIESAPDAYDITIFNAEPRVNYDRIMLSPVLSGDKTFDQIIIHGDSWYVKHGITLYKGVAVTKIDRDARTVTSAIGETVPYDKLIIATGSRPIIIPVPGASLPGVLTYRDLDDVEAMLLAAKSRGSAVVIGGGLLGLEAANGLKVRGMEVTVVHLMPTADGAPARRGGGRHAAEVAGGARASSLLTEAQTAGYRGRERQGRAVRFKDGDASSRPTWSSWPSASARTPRSRKQAGLTATAASWSTTRCRRTIRASMRSASASSHRGIAYGLVAPLFEHGQGLRQPPRPTSASAATRARVTSTKLKVTGIDLFSAGDFTGGEDTEEIVLRDAGRGVYKKLVMKDDKLVGAVLYGDTVDGAWYFQLLRDGADVADIRDKPDVRRARPGRHRPQGQSRAAAMADDAEVCGCNGVCKGTIVKAIKDKGLFTLDDVRKHTKASCVLRLLHRPGRAAPAGDAWRRLLRRAAEEADVRLHRPHPRGGARRDPRAAAADRFPR